MVNKNLKLAILKVFDSQADFAAACGISEAKVSQVVRGRKQLSEPERKVWAKKLRMKPQELSFI